MTHVIVAAPLLAAAAQLARGLAGPASGCHMRHVSDPSYPSLQQQAGGMISSQDINSRSSAAACGSKPLQGSCKCTRKEAELRSVEVQLSFLEAAQQG
jgi:hypothetical protein